MIYAYQTPEELFLKLLKVFAAKISQQRHAIKPGSPCVKYFRPGRSTKGKFLILNSYHLRNYENARLQITWQFAAHKEVVSSGCERVLRISLKQLLCLNAQRLVSEQVIDFCDGNPTSRLQIGCPCAENNGQIWK